MAVAEIIDAGLATELQAAQQYIGVLERIIQKYGQHTATCAYVTTGNRYQQGLPCNCGFDDRPRMEPSEVTQQLADKVVVERTNKTLREKLVRFSDAIEVLYQESVRVNGIR